MSLRDSSYKRPQGSGATELEREQSSWRQWLRWTRQPPSGSRSTARRRPREEYEAAEGELRWEEGDVHHYSPREHVNKGDVTRVNFMHYLVTYVRFACPHETANSQLSVANNY